VAYTLEQIDAFYSSLDAIPTSLDSIPWNDSPVSDNYTVGTHGAAIADSQPRGKIWGLAISIATQTPPTRPIIVRSPQEFYQGYGLIFHNSPPTASSEMGGNEYQFGTHQRDIFDQHSRGATWKYPHGNVQAPSNTWTGSRFVADQESTEQPFVRLFRAASITSIAPTAPPNRNVIRAAPESVDLQPFARLFKVAVYPASAVPPFKRFIAAPESVDLQPFARLFKAATIRNADTPQICPVFCMPPVEEQMPSNIWGYQPLNSDFIPDISTWVVVPYLIGYTQTPAEAVINAIYCVPSVIGTTGTVSAQSPDAFTLVPRGTTITITLGGDINSNSHRKHRGHGQPPYGSPDKPH
jgi:hypothetical protein